MYRRPCVWMCVTFRIYRFMCVRGFRLFIVIIFCVLSLETLDRTQSGHWIFFWARIFGRGCKFTKKNKNQMLGLSKFRENAAKKTDKRWCVYHQSAYSTHTDHLGNLGEIILQKAIALQRTFFFVFFWKKITFPLFNYVR